MIILKTYFYFPNKHVNENDLNSRFISKLNPFNTHLLFNPHQLPCGNIVCIECIIQIYLKMNLNTLLKDVKVNLIYWNLSLLNLI